MNAAIHERPRPSFAIAFCHLALLRERFAARRLRRRRSPNAWLASMVLPSQDAKFGDYQANLRDAAGQAARQAAARDRAAARRCGRRGRPVRAAGNRRARASSICGSRTIGSPSSSTAAIGDAERLGVAAGREAADDRHRLLVAQRGQADARRPHPLDGDRRRALPHAEVPRPSHDQRQPPRRLGHAVRHDHLRLQALCR